jgi:CrcB protein
MKATPAVAIGAVIGAGLRYGVTNLTTDVVWSTLVVNLIGCFALGFVLVHGERYLKSFPSLQVVWRPFLATGLLGGFTTTSALAVQSELLIQNERSMTALLLIALSLLGGLLSFHIAQSLAVKSVQK